MTLRGLRSGDRPWRISVLSGPNVARTGVSAAVAQTNDDIAVLLRGWGDELGVQVDHFGSQHEGHLLEYIPRVEREDRWLPSEPGWAYQESGNLCGKRSATHS